MAQPILTVGGGMATMAQGPQTPWRNEQEAEEYAADPKEFMLSRCQLWMDNVTWFGNSVIAATYYLPAFEILPGGQKFFRSEKSQDEALWQGKVGLVLGLGPLAFVDDERNKFHGQYLNIGDWIMWDIHDARQFTVNRVHCRWIPDVRILGKVDDPKLVY
jgi:hypothetical protein